jgi:hypothetical protein
MSEPNATTFNVSANVPNVPTTPRMAYLPSSSPLPFGYAVYQWPHTYHPHPVAVFASPSHQSTPTRNAQIANPQETKREYLSKVQKVQRIFGLLDKWDWSLGDLLVYIFTEQVDEEGKVKDSGHNQRIQNFLSGSTERTPAHVMKLWIQSRFGRPQRLDPKDPASPHEPIFSTTSRWQDLKAFRPVITSLATTLVCEELQEEVCHATRKQNGLHTFTTGAEKITEDDHAVKMFSEISAHIKGLMPLSWHFLMSMATPIERKPQKRQQRTRPSGTAPQKQAVRTERSPEMVCFLVK